MKILAPVSGQRGRILSTTGYVSGMPGVYQGNPLKNLTKQTEANVQSRNLASGRTRYHTTRTTIWRSAHLCTVSLQFRYTEATQNG